MSFEHFKTQILLLHPQQSTLDVFSSGFNEKYAVHVATSGTEALNTLVETPIDVIVTAQQLGGMTGLDAIREARKRSPDTIGILLVGADGDDDVEAMVGDQEVFQIVRGSISPTELRELIDTATRQARLLALAGAANDQAANPDEPISEHIVMETSENGSTIISDGTGRMPVLKPEKVALMANVAGRQIDVLVLTKDDEFLATIRDSARGLHNIHHANTPAQAEGFVKGNKVGVLVTDAAMVGSDIEAITQSLRKSVPRLVAVVAGRRDDGEMLMELISRGAVYRFLLKPVSPGRARLAIEASVKHHLEASDSAFKAKPKAVTKRVPPKPATPQKPKAKAKAKPPPKAKQQPKPQPKSKARPAPKPLPASAGITAFSEADRLSELFDNQGGLGETMTGLANSVGKSLSGVPGLIAGGAKSVLVFSGGAVAKLLGIILAPLRKPRNTAIAATLLAVVGGGYWVSSNWDSLWSKIQSAKDSGVPMIVESDIPMTNPGSAVFEAPVVSAADELLDQARSARGSGYIYSPPGANAVELYVAALSTSPGDPIIAAELEDVVDQTLTMVEKALLEQRTDDAAEGLQMVRLADSDNSRLLFLDAQIRQMQLRNALDQARAAIRGGRFEDAGNLIGTAESVNTGDASEIEALKHDLSAARSEQQVDQVLAMANERLNDNKLIAPSNDNARYYYQLALSNDPGNQAAQQGMTIIASKLVHQARQAIDEEHFQLADTLLKDAKALDPTSTDLAASRSALVAARDKQEADQKAAAKRLVEADRRAVEREAEADRRAAEREAEADRLAEAERRAQVAARAAREKQAELERELELQRRADAQERAELERQLQAQVDAEAQKRVVLERRLSAQADLEAEKRIQLERQLDTQRRAEANKRAELERELDARRAEDQKRASDELAAAAVAAANARARAARNAREDAAPISTSKARKLAGSNRPQFDPSPPPPDRDPQTIAMNRLPVERLSPPVESRSVSREPERVAISQLRRTTYVPPKYPRSAQRKSTSGWVDLGFTVARDGTVHSIEIIDSTPGTTFDEAATKAVSQWRFDPVIENGTAVEKRAAVRMQFSME